MATTHQHRVLMLLQNSQYSQDGRVIREATALRDAGYAVTVICPRGDGERCRMVFDGVHAYQYPLVSVGTGFVGYVFEYGYAVSAMFVLSLWVFIVRGFDVIHAHNPPEFLVAVAAFYRLFGKRFVFDHHDLSPEMYRMRFGDRSRKPVHALLLLFERLTCRMADHVIATNESVKKLEAERTGISEEKITVVRNGPEPRHFADIAAHSSLSQINGTVIGYVGEMGPLDGIDTLLRSLRCLQDDLGRNDWRAVLVGDGESFGPLKQLACELGIDDTVCFVGRVPLGEVVPYIAGMDICAIPDPCNEYTRRCTLVKTMEYMAQGKPIVAFDLTETRFSAGASALYVGDNDEHAFAQALAELMDDPPRRESMGRAGRERAEAELAWCHSVPSLLSVYAEVCGRPAGPGRPNPPETCDDTHPEVVAGTTPVSCEREFGAGAPSQTAEALAP